MKYVYTLLALMLLAPLSTKAQYDYDFFAVGVNLSLPIGDPADIADFGIGVEASYLKDIIGRLTVGGSLSYDRYFADELDGLSGDAQPDDIEFVGVMGKALYRIGEQGFGLGLDLGYSFGMGDTESGLTYIPKAYLNLEKVIVSLGYKGVNTDAGNFDFVVLGVKYKI